MLNFLLPEYVGIRFEMLFALMITYLFTITLVRISILLLYRRILYIKSFRIIMAVMSTACVI